MDADEEDFIFYGTPIEREEELTSRKKKAAAEASGQLRTLPSWKQEVRDEEGRRRFHGAFTGGFSAGYYNTVGSKEGWTPQLFTSSRKNRAEIKQQSILNFLDDDEKAELEGQSLGTSSQFDTFGFTAAEFARKQAKKEQKQRPSAIPGPIPDELVLPATESIGVKLLLKMGWRRGHSIKELRANSSDNTRREARKALLAFSSADAKVKSTEPEPAEEEIESFIEQPVNHEVHSSRSTPVYVQNPKQDLHGLGYDPYKHAPEFRERKRACMSSEREPRKGKPLSMGESLFGFKSGKAAPGFGIGALEEYDTEDEDVYASAFEFEDTYVKEIEESSRSSTDHKRRLGWKDQDALPGFRVASHSDYHLERFDPPVIPKDFIPQHKFPGPLKVDKHSVPPPPEVLAPEDGNLKLLIEGVATLVSRCGKLFEDLSREKNRANPLFSFLDGGNGQDYYARKLWEEQQKHGDHKKLGLTRKSSLSVEKMTAESRGKILGERPLERSSRDLSTLVSAVDINLQLNLSDTFTNSASFNDLPEVEKPFKDDPAKQERFEHFLKEKYQGGLRTTDSGGASNMSEAARARERLDFEAAAEAMERGKSGEEDKALHHQIMELPGLGGMQFTSGGLEKSKDVETDNIQMKGVYPKREEFQWRPAPVLCKRFDLIDPYVGKPPPAPRVKSKLDSLIFTSDALKFTKVEESITPSRNISSVLQSDTQETSNDAENEAEVKVENVERQVDLYKAIFSDDSDDDEAPNAPEKKTEVAHTMLNRLIAGDFLESLGKELGFEVPPDQPYPPSKATTTSLQQGTANARNAILQVERKLDSSSNAGLASSDHRRTGNGVIALGSETQKNDGSNSDMMDDDSRYMEPGSSDAKLDLDKIVEKCRGHKSPPTCKHELSSSSLSEDERSRKRSRQRRYRSSDSHMDLSSDDDPYHSRSRREKGSPREKRRSSRRHSKHHKHGRRDSHTPSRSSRSGKKEYVEDEKEKRKRRD